MKIKLTSLTIFVLFWNVISFGQYNVLLENGKSFTSPAIKLIKGFVMLSGDGEGQTIAKTDVLCVINESGSGYTFRKKNDKTKTVKRKYLKNIDDSDRAKIFAYKYYGTKCNIGELYRLNPNNKLSEEEFESIFTKQQNKMRYGTGVAVSSLILATVGLMSTLKSASSLKQ